jgi:hypothetical protein
MEQVTRKLDFPAKKCRGLLCFVGVSGGKSGLLARCRFKHHHKLSAKFLGHPCFKQSYARG